MDPRRKDYNPDYSPVNPVNPKRPSSRSPEGAAPRKVTKPNSREHSSTPSMQNSSRRSSVSNATARPGGPNGVPGFPSDNRRPSSHLPTDMRKESGAAAVNSPDSLGSRYEDAPSGRSTPASVNGLNVRPNVPPVPQMNRMLADAMATNPVIDALMNFSTQVTQLAVTQVSKARVEADLKRATTEYDNMKGHFASFPAIKEQKTTAKSIAESHHKVLVDKLDEQMSVQKHLVEGIAALFSQAAEVKPVPRADPSIQEDLAKLRDDIRNVEQRVTSKVDDLAAKLKESDAKIIARIENVQGQANNQGKRIGQVSDISEKLKNLENWKKELDRRTRSSDTSESTKDALDTQLKVKKMMDETPQLFTAVKEMKEKLNLLMVYTMGEKDERLDTPVDNRSSSLGKKVLNLQQQMQVVDKEFVKLKGEVTEKGKEPVVKRLKNLDMMVNNLASQVQSDGKPPLMQRLSQLEQDYNALEADVRAEKASAQLPVPVGNGVSIDMSPFNERLQKVESDLNGFEEQIQEKDEAVSDWITEQVNGLQGQITGVVQLHSEDEEKINASFSGVDVGIGEIRERLVAIETSIPVMTATAMSLSGLNTSMEDIKGKLGSKADKEFVTGAMTALENQLKASTASRTPTPRPPQSATPHLPNGSAGTPMVNGYHPANTGSPQATGMPTAILQRIDKDIQGLIDKHDMLTHVTTILQKRYDNLTTDEVCQAMLDQLAVIWPHANNFEIETNTIKEQLHGLESSIEFVKKTANAANESAEVAKNNANAVKDMAKGAKGDVEKLKQTVDSSRGSTDAAGTAATEALRNLEELKQAVSGLQQKVSQGALVAKGKAVDGVGDMTAEEIRALKNQLTAVEKTANNAEVLSKKHDGRLSKLNPEEMKRDLQKLRSDFDKLIGKVDVHDSTLSRGEAELSKVGTEMTRLKERLGKLEGTVSVLEEDWDRE